MSGGSRVSTLDLVQPDWVLLTQDQRWCAAAANMSERVGIELRCTLIGGPAKNSELDAGSALDLPIERIATDPQGKSVLDANLPQILSHANYETFKSMSLRQLQPLSRGQLTDEALATAESELAVVMDGRTLLDPVDTGAFLVAFGINPAGASLIRPDGYIAWRSAGFPSDPTRELADALRAVSFPTSLAKA
jgi:hypothetical protein